MRILRDVAAARETILRRLPAEEAELPPHVRDGVRRVFGRDLTAAGVADAICTAVARDGDAAVRDFTSRIDDIILADTRISPDTMAAARDRIDPALRAALE